MSEMQIATLFAASPFLALSAAWMLGLAFLFRGHAPEPVRAQDERRYKRVRRA